MKRLLCHLLGLCPIDELYAARAEAELLRMQLECAQAVVALLTMQMPGAVMPVMRVERGEKELN